MKNAGSNAQRWSFMILAVLALALAKPQAITASLAATDADSINAIVEQLQDTVAALQARVAELEARVKMLEARLGEQAESEPAAAATAPVLLVESIELQEPDHEAILRARSLEREAEGYKKKAQEAREKEIKHLKVPDHYHGNSDVYRRKQTEYRRLREKYRNEAMHYESEARKLRAQASKIESEAKEPRHIIRGWDGQRSVVLVTQRNLTRVLSTLSPGDFITWRGNKTHSDAVLETWDVVHIDRAERPSGFVNRPG